MTIRRGKALVVDDEPGIRQLLAKVLDQEMFYCFTAADGPQALEEAARHTFDLVLLDVMMPGMSGIEVLGQMRVMQPDACFVMISALTDAPTAVEAMKLGAHDYITKPFDLKELAARLQEALRRRDVALQQRDREKALQTQIETQNQEIRGYVVQTVQSLAHQHILEQEHKGGAQGSGSKVTPKDLFARLLRQREGPPKPPDGS